MPCYGCSIWLHHSKFTCSFKKGSKLFMFDLILNQYVCVFIGWHANPAKMVVCHAHGKLWSWKVGHYNDDMHIVMSSVFPFSCLSPELPKIAQGSSTCNFNCFTLFTNYYSHGKVFAHWTDMSKALLAGEVPSVFRLKRKLDDMTEVSLQSFFLSLYLLFSVNRMSSFPSQDLLRKLTLWPLLVFNAK